MTEKNRDTRTKSFPGATLSTINFTYTEMGSKRDLRGIQTNINLHYIEIFVMYRAVNTLHMGSKTDNLILYWDMRAFCSEIHKTRHKIFVGKMHSF